MTRFSHTTNQFDQAYDQAHNADAEAAVLGGCLNGPDKLDWLDLDQGAFFDPRHQAIWAAMHELRRRGVGVDVLTVCDELRRAGKEAAVGGLAYVAQLELRLPTTDNVVNYAEIVRKHHTNRRLILLAGQVPARVLEGLEGEELLQTVQLSLSEIEPRSQDAPVGLGTAVEQEMRSIIEFHDRQKRTGETVGVTTGIRQLDEHIGGLPVGSPSVLAARPGAGKSTMALNIAANAQERGGVHVFTYEDRRHTFAQRMLSNVSGVDVSRIRSRTLERHESRDLMGAADILRSRNGIVVEHAHGMGVHTLCRRVRGRRRELKTRLVIVDYLQLMPASERRMKRYEAIGANMQALAELAGKDDLAVLVCSQLGRDSEKDGRRPRLSDLRESGDIEQIGKLIVLLHRTSEDAPHVEVIVAKNHQGPKAIFDLPYDRARCRMG